MILDLGWISKQIIETKMALSTSFGVVFAHFVATRSIKLLVSDDRIACVFETYTLSNRNEANHICVHARFLP